jgi:hypothetical protein
MGRLANDHGQILGEIAALLPLRLVPLLQHGSGRQRDVGNLRRIADEEHVEPAALVHEAVRGKPRDQV